MNQPTKAYGYDKETGSWIFGDCTVNPDGSFTFPHENEISLGGAIDAPLLFPGRDNPQEYCAAIDWEDERKECLAIWEKACSSADKCTGHRNGTAIFTTALQYLTHPLSLRISNNKPSLWIFGAKGSGKSIFAQLAMRFFGYVFQPTFSSNSTTSSLERTLSTFSCLPVHIDEWRNDNEGNMDNHRRNQILRNSYSEIATVKGTNSDAEMPVKKIIPLTIPIITCENNSDDPALRSRFIHIELLPSVKLNLTAYIKEAKEDSLQYQRVTRFILRNHPQFLKEYEYFKEGFAVIAKEEGIECPRTRSNISSLAATYISTLYVLHKAKPCGMPGQARASIDTFIKFLCEIHLPPQSRLDRHTPNG